MMTIDRHLPWPRRLGHLSSRLAASTSGVALLEFAFAMPLVLTVGLYAAETSNLALTNLRVNQIALNLADNASRVGLHNSDNREEVREIDLNDVLAGARLQGESLELTKRGRITLSSLEEHDGDQLVHWQRCIGAKSGVDYDSHHGKASPTDGLKDHDDKKKDYTDGLDLKKKGMGPAGQEVVAPDDSGVMFVEINYEYNPIVSTRWLPSGSRRIHYIASLIVRDRRIFDKIYNPNPAATRMTCDKYSET